MSEINWSEELELLGIDKCFFPQYGFSSFPKSLNKKRDYGFFILAQTIQNIINDDETVQGKKIFRDIRRGERIFARVMNSEIGEIRPIIFFSLELVRRFWRFKYTFHNLDSQPIELMDFVDQFNHLISLIDTNYEARKVLTSDSSFEEVDIRVAKIWSRAIRVSIWANLPLSLLPETYSFAKDLTVLRNVTQNKLFYTYFKTGVDFYQACYKNNLVKLEKISINWLKNVKASGIKCNNLYFVNKTLEYCERREEYIRALEWIDELFLFFPKNKELIKWKIRHLRYIYHFPMALELCNQLVKRSKKDAGAFCLRSHIYLLMGNVSKAIADAVTAVELTPNFESFSALGYAYLVDEDFDKALYALLEAKNFDETDKQLLRSIGKSYIMLGESYEAIMLFRDLIKTYPQDLQCWLDLADTYFLAGYLETSKRTLKKIIGLDPSIPAAYILLGMISNRENDEEGAFGWLTKALELEPDNPIVLNELAYLYHMNGNEEKCLELLYKAVELAPDLPEVVCSLAIVCYYQSRFDEAIDFFEKVLALEPDNIDAITGKGNVYLAKSEAEEALYWYDQALHLDDFHREALLGKASVYRSLGLEQEAMEWSQKAAETENDLEDKF